MTDRTDRYDADSTAQAPPERAARILAALRRRQRGRASAQWASRGAFLGALLAVVAALVLLVTQPPGLRRQLGESLLLVPVFAVLGGLFGRLRRVDDLEVARALDRAADSADGFASAMQLADHRHPERVGLILHDALARVRSIRPATALPLRTPPQLKWLPLPVLVVTLAIVLAPNQRLVADQLAPPEISEEEWEEVNDEFRQELADLPEPQTQHEREMAAELRQLADMLEKRPDKKDALAQVARLRAELQKRQQSTNAGDVSMRQAARAMQPAAALGDLAAALQKGDYSKAADEARALAERLQQDKQKLSAGDFEAIAADFEALAREMKSPADLNEACRKCASAATSMNRQSLSENVRRFGENLRKNSEKLRNCDSNCRSKSALDRLAQKLSQCRGGKCGKCKNCGSGTCKGKCSGNGLGRNPKNGQKAGWGTAERWTGGGLAPTIDQRTGEMADVEIGEGENTVHTTVSPDERAASAQSERDRYVELIRKSEADLALESIPVAYRDYLRRYFVAIRPSDAPAEPASENP
jgi:hypothetical protein